jgi:hypothetical protein
MHILGKDIDGCIWNIHIQIWKTKINEENAKEKDYRGKTERYRQERRYLKNRKIGEKIFIMGQEDLI